MTPLLRVSRLSDPPRVYLLTRYRVRPGQPAHIIATTKYEVTDEFLAAAKEWRRATRKRVKKPS